MGTETLFARASGWKRFSKRLPIVCCFLAAALLMGGGASLYGETAQAAIARSSRATPAEAMEILSTARLSSGDHVELLISLSRFSSNLVDAQVKEKKTAEAEKMARVAVEAAERAVQLAPRNPGAHLALAVSCGKLTEYVDNSRKMELSRRIRDAAEATIALDPQSDTAYHILGRWNYGIASLNPMLKLAARVAYEALPPASLENAAQLLEKAAVLKPEKIMHHQYLAIVYKKMGEKKKAAAEWEIVLRLPSVDDDDEDAKKEARSALGR